MAGLFTLGDLKLDPLLKNLFSFDSHHVILYTFTLRSRYQDSQNNCCDQNRNKDGAANDYFLQIHFLEKQRQWLKSCD